MVRGERRTYKIHLGSGNILMEPNDQYLCIVPDSRSKAKQDDLFLPFEGDNTLSIILSKAMLLAEDGKIKDSDDLAADRRRVNDLSRFSQTSRIGSSQTGGVPCPLH